MITELNQDSCPRLAPGVRLHFDRSRDCWVVLAPERVLMPDEIALEILRRCDGEHALSAIIGELARNFEADQEEVAADVMSLLKDLADKRIIAT